MTHPLTTEREQLVFGDDFAWHSHDRTIAFFRDGEPASGPPITPEQARTLIDRGYLDPTARQNRSPPTGLLVEFVHRIAIEYPDPAIQPGLIGYVISPERDDCRITITGFVIEGPIPAALTEEVKHHFLFGTADEMTHSPLLIRYWWD